MLTLPEATDHDRYLLRKNSPAHGQPVPIIGARMTAAEVGRVLLQPSGPWRPGTALSEANMFESPRGRKSAASASNRWKFSGTGGARILSSAQGFETREQCVQDAARHGWLGFDEDDTARRVDQGIEPLVIEPSTAVKPQPDPAAPPESHQGTDPVSHT